VETIEFKDQMSRIPNSVSVIGVLNGDQILGCTISSLISVDIDNPELMFVLKNGSATLNALSSVGTLSVNVLGASQQYLAVNYSTVRAQEKYFDSESAWSRSMSGVIYLKNSLVSFICKVNRIVPMKSTTLIFCAPEEVFGDKDSQPLIYVNRKFLISLGNSN
jgi:flavin reductase (DIM6/NTAB) family NADH-FMN oxidoreductase RutF